MYDFLIVGLGIAGANIARLLSEKYNVAAIDKKHAGENSFMKPCGGLLCPTAQKALASNKIVLPKSILVSPQIFNVETIDFDNGIARTYNRNYINVDRHKLDMYMISLIKNADIIDDACVCDIEYRGNFYAVSYMKHGEKNVMFTRKIIGADGANSIVRKYLRKHEKRNYYVAINQFFESTIPPISACIFDSSLSPTYSWMLTKDDKLLFGGAYPAQNCRKAFEMQKTKLKNYGFDFGKVIKTEACKVISSKNPFNELYFGEHDVFLIGEAAGLISTSFEGISSALESSRVLAQVLISESRYPYIEYSARLSPQLLNLLIRGIVKAPSMYYVPMRKIIMETGILAINQETYASEATL